MRAWVIVVVLVIIGIVGAWVGYWVGHALGWTTDAEFPLRIGAGERAIGLSILVSFLSVMAGAGWLIARPLLRIRHLLATGIPARATVRRAWRTGVAVGSLAAGGRHELAFELEVHPETGVDYPAKALGVLTEAEEREATAGTEVLIRFDRSHPDSVVVVGPLGAAAG